MTTYTQQEKVRQEAFRKNLWDKLKTEAKPWENSGGLDIDMHTFDFIWSRCRGQITEENTPYDGHYLHRIEVNSSKDNTVYRFKTITKDQNDFEIPF